MIMVMIWSVDCLFPWTGLLMVGLMYVASVRCLVDPIPMPSILADCYRLKTLNISISDVPSQEINMNCITQYLYQTSGERYQRPIANETIIYVQELFRQLIGKYQVSRKKRQIRRVRYEVRMMPRPLWNQFVGRLNALKRQWVIPGRLSRYDSIADIHRIVVNTAHNGPAFFPWHRIYLLIIEQALGVPVPYWDSRIDYYMDNPTDSVVWTSEFFGNGFGDVTTGPFSGWITPENVPLVRNIGNDGTLINDNAVQSVLSRRWHAEITEPNTNPQFSLEGHHNGPHVWIDGQISAPLTAAQDPVFFMHHAFIDYFWNLFRARQRVNGVIPANDYPPARFPAHQPFAPMIPFRGLRNVDGFNDFFESLVVYQPSPTCPACGPYMECRGGRCVSRVGLVPVTGGAASFGAASFGAGSGRTMMVPSSTGGRERTRMTAARTGPLPIGPKFRSFYRDPRTRGDSLQNAPPRRTRRSTVDARNSSSHHKHLGISSQLDRPYQNTFVLDGISEMKRWVFIPVRIIYERPPEAKFHSFIIQNGKLVKSSDVFLESGYKGLKVQVRQKTPATYPKCGVSGSGASKVFVQTDGIDYSGRYKDYAVVDERQPVSSSMTYVGVKNPAMGAAKVYMTAYDMCGRVCQPQCLVQGSYQPCSGAFRITSESPKMYGSTYQDAVESIWNLNKNVLSAGLGDTNAPVTFLCKVRNTWPWVFI